MKLEDALVLIRELEPKFDSAGYHLGLTGSVLYKGESIKDLDLICYPHDERVKRMNRDEMQAFIKDLRFQVLDQEQTSAYDWNKEVHVCYLGNQRVDFFHMF